MVHKAIWNGTLVAVKILKISSAIALADFRSELEVCARGCMSNPIAPPHSLSFSRGPIHWILDCCHSSALPEAHAVQRQYLPLLGPRRYHARFSVLKTISDCCHLAGCRAGQSYRTRPQAHAASLPPGHWPFPQEADMPGRLIGSACRSSKSMNLPL